MKSKKELSAEAKDKLIQILKNRFEQNMQRHIGLEWEKIEAKLQANPEKFWSINEMELTEGEPDVIGFENGEFLFVDCCKESPKGRRSHCYDRAALEARKLHKPENSSMDLANEMEIEMLTEEQYRALQELGEFDLKTSSWVKTPEEIRKLGGAIFCDRRYGKVFTYHNGADSYYGARGFRGIIRI